MSGNHDQKDQYAGKKLEGRYELQELIGTGGMANVYKAYDIIDQRTVAVKILREEYLSNNEFLRRFKNESKAIAVLSHPNIVRVYDVSFTSRAHSIVMEYIDGITLKEYIERQNKLSWKESVHFTLQILRALQHAHEKGIVHRDIKPQNIMLLQNGTIKVTDFGIARFARSEVRSITDRAIGSVHYISPEQAMGENTDARSDLYSVGVMLFEMLTGKLPFEADSAVSVAIKQIQSQAARPTQINPDIPAGLEDITMRAMQKEASQRYQSAGAMIEDIERFKQDPSIQFQYKYLTPENQKPKQKTGRNDPVPLGEKVSASHKRRRTPYIPILTGVTFAFVLAAIAFIGLMLWLNNPFAQVPEVVVPALVGLKFDTAKSQYSNIEIVQVEIVNNDEYGMGVIFEQDPRADRTVREGSVVKVKVSSGQRLVTIENFENRDAAAALQKLEDQGLKYEETHVYDDKIPKGYVIYTDPSKGSEVASGTLVNVVISLGKEEFFKNVPDVNGLTLEKGKQMLEMFNFRVGNVTYEQRDEPENTIVAQDPAAGDLQLEGTGVNLVVSKGQSSGFKRVAITVPISELDRIVRLQAYVDGAVVAEEYLDAAETPNWKPFFEGEDETITIEIYADGQKFREYKLDFSTDTFRDTPRSQWKND